MHICSQSLLLFDCALQKIYTYQGDIETMSSTAYRYRNDVNVHLNVIKIWSYNSAIADAKMFLAAKMLLTAKMLLAAKMLLVVDVQGLINVRI